MAAVTITTTAAQDARLAPAFGRYLGLTNGAGAPRNATTAEVKGALIQFLRDTVQTYETARVQETAPQTPFDPT